jgi:regulator of sirC expression with transglutaminase-like and TPR domain
MFINRVIERRRGLPVALSLLYICAAEANGWSVHGLNMPGHFILRINDSGVQTLFDPFQECKILNAHDLRELLKSALGPSAELSAEYYNAVTKRDVLIRLLNNIKLRMIQHEGYKDALKIVELMRIIDPDEYRLLLDAGVLYAKVGMAMAALPLLDHYIEKAPDSRDRQEAALLLSQIRTTLN